MHQHWIWRRSVMAGLVFTLTACFSPPDVVGAGEHSGTDGKNAAIRLVPEPPGTRCPQGGTAILTGLDDNEDGALSDDEVKQTSYVCSGGGGQTGSMSLVKLMPEAAGARCASGGTAVLSGLDTNSDGIQGDTEVSSTQYLCNGEDGKSGNTYLVKLLPESSGTHCPRNGTAVLGGIDANANAQLEGDEVTTTQYVCTPMAEAVGNQALIRLDAEPAGANCSQGGTAVKSGLDANSNGSLETSEVTNTTFVCNGLRGNDGKNGKNSLVRLDPDASGTNCAYGGMAVKSGLDLNGDKVLNDTEVTTTQFVCSMANLFRTKWASNPRGGYASGEITNLWVPVSRRVSIYKTKDTSRIKLTISDNFRVGLGSLGGGGWYSVRMNGSGMGCDAKQYNSNPYGMTQDYQFPFANICLTDQLPKGLYEFDVWSIADGGTSYMGGSYSGSAMLLVEEMDDNQPYAFSKEGVGEGTASTSLVKVNGREVTFTKQSTSSLLKVTLADTFRVSLVQDGASATVMVRLDGAVTGCYTGKQDAQGRGANIINPFVMTCILSNVSAGRHQLDVAFSHTTGGGDAHLGWERSSPLLLVEELPNTGLTFSSMNIGSGELSGDWAGVGARQIAHNVSLPGKTLKVTYSDTFRAVANCNNKGGSFQLYVDYQPTGCINGQFVSSAGPAQNHHHPMNLTCLVPNLMPGYHTFSIWSTTLQKDGSTCGSNFFGWNRGQNLLMVEELP
jgi:hypothetical protein